jgi:hypothetical protein
MKEGIKMWSQLFAGVGRRIRTRATMSPFLSGLLLLLVSSSYAMEEAER